MEKYKGRPTSNEGRSEVEIKTYDFLDKTGITYETFCHEAAYTTEQCHEIQGVVGVDAPICKNLFLCNRQQNTVRSCWLPLCELAMLQQG